MDNPKSFNLKLCPRLCYDDINPQGYQKMNVGRAYRVSIEWENKNVLIVFSHILFYFQVFQ